MENFTFCEVQWKGIPEKQTRDSEPGTRVPPPGILHQGPGTRDLGPYMQDPIWNWDQIPLRGTRDPYINTNLGALTLIQLSLNVQFSSVAQLFQTGSYTNLYNLTEEQTTQLKTFTFTFYGFFRTYLKITNQYRSEQRICNKGGL